jgi:hypothetical protein
MMRAFPIRNVATINVVGVYVFVVPEKAVPILFHWFPLLSWLCRRLSESRNTGWCLFHRGSVFATARRLVASGAMNQSLLGRDCVSFFASPNLHSRLLNGAGKRKCQRPWQLRLEPNVHGV